MALTGNITKVEFEQWVGILIEDGWQEEGAGKGWMVIDPEGNIAGGTSRYAAWVAATNGFEGFVSE